VLNGHKILLILVHLLLAFQPAETATQPGVGKHIKFKQTGSLNNDELKYLVLQSVRFLEKVEDLGLELGRY